MNEEDLKSIDALKEKAVEAQMWEVVTALREAGKLLKKTLVRIES